MSELSVLETEKLSRFPCHALSVETSTTPFCAAQPPPSRLHREFFFWNLNMFPIRLKCSSRNWYQVIESGIDWLSWASERVVYIIGPILIVVALWVISMLTYVWCTILIPMWQDKYRNVAWWWRGGMLMVHGLIVGVILLNVLFNYWLCVTTKHSGPEFDKVVRELAVATGFTYPGTPEQVQHFRHEFEDFMVLRMRRRQARAWEKTQQEQQQQQHQQQEQQPQQPSQSPLHAHSVGSIQHRRQDATTNGRSTISPAATGISVAPLRKWMLLGPFEWGFCGNSNQPKPPRSHFDHVTKTLVLNLDHYCPWMFNTIGYFNYRYFVLFMIYVWMGMIYGVVVTYEPFMLIGTMEYKHQYALDRQPTLLESKTLLSMNGTSSFVFSQQLVPTRLQPMLPFSQERMLLTLGFMLCISLLCAISLLGGFHVYLVCTAQTTIEWHANWSLRRRDSKYKNPYSQGSWRKNWAQVFDTPIIWRAILSKKGSPSHLPVPLPGQDNRRCPLSLEEQKLMKNYQAQQLSTWTV